LLQQWLLDEQAAVWGLLHAAQALGLDFVPLFEEEYDLVVPAQYYDTPILKPFRDALSDQEFLSQVAKLQGYDFHPSERFGHRFMLKQNLRKVL